ncbi:GtrA family protein [Ferrovibrio terrae]|uniref:GtrA family protein n=1 Tax=Ferrovibrio terrae TaxID=2594003 RepID=UPI0031381F02
MPERLLALLPGALRQRARAHADLLRFVVVGGIGFCVDGGLLMLLNDLADWTPLAARAIGFPVAVTVTWWLNRVWTFSTGRSQPVRRQYALYLAIQLTGLAINFSIFALLVGAMPWFATWPIAALAIGSVTAMFGTYILSRRIAFAAKTPSA